ncbi:NUDIX hydrolase [Parvularcula dongshanensis]|uniref:8-oxo-dGTP diphosphatase n=1 Tax=Parvularcula dongshanensis TaxID=1173995 RepID=A0A840I2E2_9PROT|nr:NUDIX hydrolase [Parvularcula dongshanensis]MBB4658462.1 8-oxo-dGTP diphosphatase [Parvularcula dongshanensis]
MADPLKPILSAGAVVFRGDRVLLIRRGRPPFLGHWSIPGGKVDHGEPLREAVLREVLEETGVTARVVGLIDAFEALPASSDEAHFVMIDFVCEHVSGEPIPGDDADDAAFLSIPEALSRIAWDKTRLAVQGALAFRRANAPALSGRVE